MKIKDITQRMDKSATYFWAKHGIGYRLVNSLTLKTAAGVENRIDAHRITRALNGAGFHIAKLEDRMGAE